MKNNMNSILMFISTLLVVLLIVPIMIPSQSQNIPDFRELSKDANRFEIAFHYGIHIEKKEIDLDTEKIEPVLDALQNALAICIKNENFMMAAGGSGWFLNCYKDEERVFRLCVTAYPSGWQIMFSDETRGLPPAPPQDLGYHEHYYFPYSKKYPNQYTVPIEIKRLVQELYFLFPEVVDSHGYDDLFLIIK